MTHKPHFCHTVRCPAEQRQIKVHKIPTPVKRLDQERPTTPFLGPLAGRERAIRLWTEAMLLYALLTSRGWNPSSSVGHLTTDTQSRRFAGPRSPVRGARASPAGDG